MKILFDTSPLCREAKTGIPIFVDKLYTALSQIDTIKVEKTFCFCKYLPRKPWYVYRFIEHILYHNIYLPFKLKFGKYDIYVENQYMFIPLFKPKNTLIVTVLYDIALQMFDTIQTKEHTQKWRERLPKSIKNSDLLLTISESSKKDIEAYLPTIQQAQKPVEYIYIDADINMQSTHNPKEILSGLHINDDYFLFLGTLEPRKNPLKLIEAFHIFKTRTQSGIKLVFAGKKGWLYKEVLTYIDTHKLSSEVIFTGFISDEEKRILLQETKAFVFLSLYEGFGIPALEALKLNTPTLLSDIPVFHELFGDNALYTNHTNAHKIANAM
jgi:glycosyltransferase involved in cell wall biosynthesis